MRNYMALSTWSLLTWALCYTESVGEAGITTRKNRNTHTRHRLQGLSHV